ncbi:hypothetical protein ACFPA8_07945 [Streptomyces ovatisporus]|uniref:Tape measure protein n=1 Tax=Streptomyces ovatisporus TaxID=1128682 RepID=A0ABV9A2E2_9ACTN
MATLNTMLIHLGIDTDRLRAGARNAQRAVRTMGDNMRRTADFSAGRMLHHFQQGLRGIRNAFRAGDADGQGRGFGRRIAAGIGSGLRRAGSTIASGLSGALSFASRSISSNPIVGVVALALASAIAHTLAPFLAAALSGLVVSATGIGIIGLGAVLLKDEPAVKKAASKLKSTVGGILKDAAKPLIPAFTKALGQIGKTFKSLENEFQGIFGALEPVIPVLNKGFMDAFKAIITGIEDMLMGSQETFKGFSSMIRKIGEGIGGFFRILGQNPKDTKLALEDLGSFIKWLLMETAKFIRFLTSTYSTVRKWVQNVISAFAWLYDVLVGHSIIPDLINAIVRWVTSLPRRTIGAVSRWVAGIIAKCVSLYQRAVSWVARMVGRVVSWIRGLPGKAAGALSSLGSRVYAKVYAAGSSMLSAAKSGVKRVVSAVKSLPGKAKDALSGIGSKLYGAGRSLVGGFVDGIASMFRKVKDKLGSLTRKLRDWKGPAPLDARILTPAGQSVIAGFMKGIDRQTPYLRKQLGGLTSDLPGMTAEVSGVIRAGKSEPQTIVLDVRGGDDEMKRLIKKWVRVDGRGNVQKAFT